jgi:bacillithiol biosynthesis cysteine-adding enzyme BshC
MGAAGESEAEFDAGQPRDRAAAVSSTGRPAARGVYCGAPVGRAFSTSYLAGEAAAAAFLPRDFRRPDERTAAAQRAARRRIDPALVAVLREQQAALPASAARDRNLEALAAGDTAVVVSGQQVGLFLGPLYTFYKAATAIAAARAIEGEAGVRCVPLFWLQTEDHDFAEIASCTAAGRDGVPVRLALDGGPPELERSSVAHRRLGADVAALVDSFAELAGTGPAAREVVALLRAHYRPGQSLRGAFAGALAEIFADEGLLFLDPRDPRVAALAAPIYRRAITGAAEIESLLVRQEQRLRAAGFECQVALRAGSPLVFFHPHGAAGPRHRMNAERRAGEAAKGGTDVWHLDGGGTVATAALLEALAHDPLRFSTSALLRPIVQDALLPTVAYVGGPAEISYFAEMDPLYAFFGVDAALVTPRARFRCIEPPARRWLEALGLEPDDVALPLPELLARAGAAGRDGAGKPDDAPAAPGATHAHALPDDLRRRVEAEIAPVVAQIADAIVADAPELTRAAERTRASIARALRRFTDRYARRLAERDGVTRQRLERLRAALYPGGVPQDRVFGWPDLAARIGPAAFKRLVFERLAANGPFVTALQELLP